MPVRPLVIAALRGLGAAALTWATAGCLQVTTGDPSGDDASTPTSPTATGNVDAGTNCGTDPQTGITLCLGVGACPGVTFDPNAWPSCGFRMTGGSTLDLECLCNEEALCPVGVATTCDQATQLLTSQTQLMVCAQVAEQRCVAVGAADAGTTSTNPPSTTSTCNQTCLAGCGAAPDCLQVCGC